jgi:hypothetical protein
MAPSLLVTVNRSCVMPPGPITSGVNAFCSVTLIAHAGMPQRIVPNKPGSKIPVPAASDFERLAIMRGTC